MSRRLAAAFVLVALTACAPKGANKPATLEITSGGNVIVRHPNFEGHLDPKVAFDKGRFTLVLHHLQFLDKSSATVSGKTMPLPHVGGDLETGIDLTAAVADASPDTIGGAQPIPIDLPIEISLFDGRQKLSTKLTKVYASTAIEKCLDGVASRAAPCVFPSDAAAPNSKPNMAVFRKGDLSPSFVGGPAKLRDIDWVVIVTDGEPAPGKKCSMKRMGPAGAATTGLEETMTLLRESVHLTVYDRRTASKLHTKDIFGRDECPVITDVALTGPKAGLRTEPTKADQERWFAELRGEATAVAPPPPAPSVTAKPTTKSKTKKKR